MSTVWVSVKRMQLLPRHSLKKIIGLFCLHVIVSSTFHVYNHFKPGPSAYEFPFYRRIM